MNERLDAEKDLDTSARAPRADGRELDRDHPREALREEHPIYCPNCGLDTGARGWRYAYPTH